MAYPLLSLLMVRQISSKWLSYAQISCEIIQAFSASFKFSQQPGVLRLGPHPAAAAAAAARREWAAAAMAAAAAESGRRRGRALVLGIVGLRSTISSGQRLNQALQALRGRRHWWLRARLQNVHLLAQEARRSLVEQLKVWGLVAQRHVEGLAQRHVEGRF